MFAVLFLCRVGTQFCWFLFLGLLLYQYIALVLYALVGPNVSNNFPKKKKKNEKKNASRERKITHQLPTKGSKPLDSNPINL